MKRPSRESGDVRGSEIMKNVKISSEPLCNWWIGMASGSPSHKARANKSAAWLARKKIAMSERRAACNTRIAKKPTSAANQTVEPQEPGEIHTPFEANSSTTMAKPAGFQMCLPSMRKTNFEPMAMTPASACSQGSSARSSRLSDSPVISGERGSNSGSLNHQVQTAWVASAAAMASALLSGRAPKSSQPRL